MTGHELHQAGRGDQHQPGSWLAGTVGGGQ